MWGFLLGGAVGYVLGARAGRERYEQLERTGRQLLDHPAVQGAAGVARAKISELADGLSGAGRQQPPPREP